MLDKCKHLFFLYDQNEFELFFPVLQSADKLRDHMVAGTDWPLGRTPNLTRADRDAELTVS